MSKFSLKIYKLFIIQSITSEYRDPWWVFPFEAIESLAVHLMWVAAATYCALLAPKNLLATLIGVSGMSHFSLGKNNIFILMFLI